MLQFTQELFDKNLIPEELLLEIQKSNNINAAGLRERTLLHHLCMNKEVDINDVVQALAFGANTTQADIWLCSALAYTVQNGRLDLYELIKPIGDHNYNAFNITSDNLLMLAITGGNETILRDVLSKTTEPLSTNRYGRTPVHQAARTGSKLIQVLLDDKRFAAAETQVDYFGDTPIDLAARYQHVEAFAVLTDNTQEIKRHSKYNQPLIDVSQDTLETKLKKYLEVQGRDPALIANSGMCNGWAFLYQSYFPDRENEYWDMVNTVATWNGEKSSLEKLTLPESLRKHYTKRKGVASAAEDLFEQLINDLAVFYSATSDFASLKLGIDQNSRVDQFTLLSSNKRSIQPIFNVGNLTLNKSQLIEQLEYMRTFLGLTVDIGGNGHQISLYITKEGDYQLFDSVVPTKFAKMHSSEDVANAMIKNKYLLHLLKDKFWLDITTYSLSHNNSHANIQRVPGNSQFDFSQSPNRYNELHYAVLDNDLEKTATIMKAHPEYMFMKNVNDQTPFDLVLLNDRIDCFNMMFADKKFEKDELSIIASKCVHSKNTIFLQTVLSTQPNLDYSSLWKEVMDENVRISMEARYQRAVHLLKNAQGNINVDGTQPNPEPPLMYAIKANHKPFFDLLLENNASCLNCEIFKEDSIYSICLDQQDDYFIEKVIAKIIDINQLDKIGNNLLHWAIIKGKPQVVKTCLNKGADITVKNKKSETAIDLLSSYPNQEIQALFDKLKSSTERKKHLKFSIGIRQSAENVEPKPSPVEDTLPTPVRHKPEKS